MRQADRSGGGDYGSDNCYSGNMSASCGTSGQSGTGGGGTGGGSSGGTAKSGNQGVSTENVPPLGNGDLWVDQWTNGNGHLWVNLNYKVAEEYRLKAAMCVSDPILLACTSATGSDMSKNVTVGQALMYWVAGISPETMVYGDGSVVAGLMARTPEAGRARRAAMVKWTRNGDRDLKVLSDYSLGGFSKAEKAQQVTRDVGSMLGNLQDPNSVKVLLGSFQIEGKALASSKRGIRVRFSVDENSTVVAAHLVTGYSGPASRMVQRDFGAGIGVFMHPVNQKITWRETLLYER